MKKRPGAGLITLLSLVSILLSLQCRQGRLRDHDFARDGVLHLIDHLETENLKATPFAGIQDRFASEEEDLSGRLRLIPELSTSRLKVWAATTGRSILGLTAARPPQGMEVLLDGRPMPFLEDGDPSVESWKWIKTHTEIDLSYDENYRKDMGRVVLDEGEHLTFEAILPEAPVEFEILARNNWHPLEMAFYVDDEFVDAQAVGRDTAVFRFAYQGGPGTCRVTLRPRLPRRIESQRPTPPRLLIFRTRVLSQNDALLFFVPFERQPGFTNRKIQVRYLTALDDSGQRHPLADAYRMKHDYVADPSDQPVNPENIKKELVLEDLTFGALMAPPPSRFVFDLQVPNSAFLEFGSGLFGYWGSPEGQRVNFKVTAEAEGRVHILHDQYLTLTSSPLRDQINRSRIDLSAFAGQAVTLSFITEAGSGTGDPDAGLPTGLAYWENPIIFQSGTQALPNVILISLDTLRADHLGCYGYPRATSPFLDSLAEESALFENTYAQSPWTLPSHLSLLFSLNSASHQVYFNDQKINATLPSLASYLRERGFLTCGFSAGGYVSRIYGFAKGFDWYDNPTKGHKKPQGKDGAERLYDVTARWLDDHLDRPFFLFLHTYQIHDPYVSPPPWNSMFIEQDEAEWTGLALHALLQEEGQDRVFTPEERANIVALYDGEIRYTDEMLLKPLVAQLKKLGIYDNTLLIVTSDHGEEFAEHGGWLHGQTLYDEAIRVPLLIKFPRSEHPGRRVSARVRLIDILPTVLDVLDISGSRGSIEGLSLIPLLSGSGHADRVFISDLAHKNIPELCPAKIATNRDDLKFIIHRSQDGTETVETYSLTQDPDERTDISVRTQKIRDEVLRLLDNYYRSKSQLDKGREQIQMTRELEERLKALGYLR